MSALTANEFVNAAFNPNQHVRCPTCVPQIITVIVSLLVAITAQCVVRRRCTSLRAALASRDNINTFASMSVFYLSTRSARSLAHSLADVSLSSLLVSHVSPQQARSQWRRGLLRPCRVRSARPICPCRLTWPICQQCHWRICPKRRERWGGANWSCTLKERCECHSLSVHRRWRRAQSAKGISFAWLLVLRR